MRALLLFAVSLSALADTGNAVCARCHAAIARQYAATPMARTSGRTGTPGFTESFATQAAAGARVAPGFVLELGGVSRRLEWFLGSGHIGRSYLFRKGGQLFQAPVSYYAEPRKWDVSPGYENKPYLEMTRAVEQACLQCHASRLQPAAAAQPFLEAGVSCERCHGAGEKHAAAPSPRNIVNPARLAPEPRDSVCAQCHLTGAARIARAGRERGSFQPGQPLRDHVAVFVAAGDAAAGPTATSHFEKFARSRCKQASGEKLWCGTCHTVHAAATPETHNRQCQTCHQPAACTGGGGPDCIACHMPKSAGASIEHLAFTDHSIPRRPAASGGTAEPVTELREFWTGSASPRDTAMGYAAAAAAEPALRAAAFAKLQAFAATSDVPLLSQLAQFQERMGREAEAAAIYERILLLDPAHAASAVNLGTLHIRQGRPREAMALWLRALARNPALIGARLNLAVAQYQSGDPAAARKSLEAVLDYEPLHPAARRMLDQLPASPTPR
jgi:hypothetical protein